MKYLLAAAALALSSTVIFSGTAAAQAEDAFDKAHAAYDQGNYAEAVKWYRMAAEQGDMWGPVFLGIMYANGEGVPEDDAEAVKWFRLAAEQGHASAQYSLGVMYEDGDGVPEDDGEAVKWYRLAADQGYARAQFNLGLMYANGHGVLEDYVQAYMWTNLAAAQGDEHAIKNKDIIRKWMTPAQIAEAQKLSSAWKPISER